MQFEVSVDTYQNVVNERRVQIIIKTIVECMDNISLGPFVNLKGIFPYLSYPCIGRKQHFWIYSFVKRVALLILWSNSSTKVPVLPRQRVQIAVVYAKPQASTWFQSHQDW